MKTSVETGLTEDNGYKYHQLDQYGTQILVQVNRHGEWFGYIGQIVKEQFDSEADALKWLNAHRID